MEIQLQLPVEELEEKKIPKPHRVTPEDHESDLSSSDEELEQDKEIVFPDMNTHFMYFNVNYEGHGEAWENLLDKLLPKIPKHPQIGIKHGRPALSVVLANLFRHHQIVPGFYTAMPRGKKHYKRKSRYNAPGLRAEALTNVVDTLHQEGMLELNMGFNGEEGKSGRYSRIVPKEPLLELFNEIPEDSTRWHPNREVILVKTAPKGKAKKKYLKPYGRDKKGTKEPRNAIGMRKRCHAYNEFLEKTDILFPMEKLHLTRENKKRAKAGEVLLDCFGKHLYRVFSDGFQKGGRFYGAWWELLPGEERSKIKINGEAVVELDFSAYHPSLLYMKYTNRLPEGDVYALPKLQQAMPGVAHDELRKVVKKAFLVLLNAKTKTAAKRSLRKVGHDDLEYKLIKAIDLDMLFSAIEDRHPDVWKYFGDGRGVELQFWDSQVADRVMRIMMLEHGIACLPVHDSFIVAEQHEGMLRAAMEKAMELNKWTHCPNIERK